MICLLLRLSVLWLLPAFGALPARGPYKVKLAANVEIGGMKNGVGGKYEQTAFVYYPSGNYLDDDVEDGTTTTNSTLASIGNGTSTFTAADAAWFEANAGNFPLISFNHGIFGGGKDNIGEYSALVADIASWGFVVAAMDGCSPMCFVYLYAKDQLNVIQRFLDGKISEVRYPWVKMVAATNAGIAGHSFGGMSTVLAARTFGNLPVKAAWALHPCPCFEGAPPQGCPATYEIKIPIVYTTGTLDTICLQKYVKMEFDKTHSPNKTYADMVGITHMEPVNSPLGPTHKLWAPYMGNYFRCHLWEDRSACNNVYGNGKDSFCHAHQYTSCINTR